MNANPEKGRKRWLGEVMAVMIALGVLVLFVLCWVAAVALCGAGCAARTGSQRRENDPSTVVKSPIGEKLQEARAQVMEMPVLGTDRLLTSALQTEFSEDTNCAADLSARDGFESELGCVGKPRFENLDGDRAEHLSAESLRVANKQSELLSDCGEAELK
jgi:hypothetical protein